MRTLPKLESADEIVDLHRIPQSLHGHRAQRSYLDVALDKLER